ncbi:MAG TPA: hypothetical protein VFT64_11740 [Rickettsiales bacterium]|nr:hypothetical protein [Rickettsiales bacterium]
MSRKRNNNKRVSASPHARGRNARTAVAKMDSFYHQTVALCKAALVVSVALYILGGTLAMRIVYHQHKGHLFSWLAGDESKYQSQAAIQKRKAAEEAELEAECKASYHMSCTEYALSIAEATQSHSKRDAKQIALLEKEKSKARDAM